MSLRGTSSRIKTSSHRVHREIIEQEKDVVELTTNSSEEVLVPPSLPSIPLPSLPSVTIPSSNENCTDSSEWTDSDGNGCYLYNQETFNCTESGADEHCCFSCTNKMGQWQLPWELPTVISTEPRPPPPLNQPPLIPSLPGDGGMNQPPLIPSLPGFGDPTLQELPGDGGMNQPPLMPPMMPSFGLPSVPIPSSDENCTDSSEWTDSDGNACFLYQRDEFNCTESGADEHCCLSCSSIKIGQNQLPWEIGILVTDPDPSPGDGGISQEISSQPSSQGSSQEDRTYDTNFIIKFLPNASIMTLAIIQTISSLLSLIASIAVICMIARSHAKLSTVFHRLLLGLCIADIVLSLSLAFSTAPIPAKYSQDIWNAQGTIDTCTAQGFFIFVGYIAAQFYNCSLCIYYLCVIKYNKKDAYIQKKVEPWLHGLPFGMSVIGANILLFHKAFNAGTTSCTIGADPPGCIDSDLVDCERGGDAKILFLIFAAVPYIVLPTVIASTMGVMYHAARQNEKKMSGYGVHSLRLSVANSRANLRANSRANSRANLNINENVAANDPPATHLRNVFRRFSSIDSTLSRSNKLNKQSKVVIQKALAYSLAYFASYMFPLIISIINLKGQNASYGLTLVSRIFFPLQGFFNFLVFIFPRILGARRSNADLSWSRAFVHALKSRGQRPRGVGRKKQSGKKSSSNNS